MTSSAAEAELLLLGNPTLWRALMKRLSMGLDWEHDANIVQKFAEAFEVPVSSVVAVMRTRCHPGNRYMH